MLYEFGRNLVKVGENAILTQTYHTLQVLQAGVGSCEPQMVVLLPLELILVCINYGSGRRGYNYFGGYV
jgi:hypothetical protein